MAQTHALFKVRLKKFRAGLAGAGLRSMIVSYLPNIRYLTGFSGSNGLLVLAEGATRFFTDSRYMVQATEEVKVAKVEICTGSLLDNAGWNLKALGRATVGIEAHHLAVDQKGLLELAAGQTIKFVPGPKLVETLREAKDASEIRSLRKAARLITQVFESVLPLVKPGVREHQLAAEIEYKMRLLGASGPSFETIVASGPRSALPHAHPSNRRLRGNELVVMDMGAILNGYCSDLTRTVYLGKAPARVRAWYKAVWEAHQAACARLRAGVAAYEVDSAARAVLRQNGLEQYFTHSLGHGIGLEIHEAPRLAKGQKAPLKAGSVVTIEPGIYIEGTGGIRIEDDVLVTRRGSEVLTRMCGELLQL